MDTTWQPLPPQVQQKLLEGLRLAVRIPLILILIALSLSSGAVLIALIYKSAVYIFQHLILKPW